MTDQNKTPAESSAPALSVVAGYAAYIRRWNFSTHGNEIWVCEGEHEKCESCCNNEREVMAAEAVRIIESLRAEVLRLSQHNIQTQTGGATPPPKGTQ